MKNPFPHLFISCPAMRLLLEVIGSPFARRALRQFSDTELLAIYDLAFPNRVALLYLSRHRREGWDARLEEKYQALKAREQATFEVIGRVAQALNQWRPDQYAVFKSIKPYPATPNDTDVICFAGRAGYEDMYRHLLALGYRFHEWAPQQRTVYDPCGVGKIGRGKQGGTYYIDLYQEISTDYFAYLNKERLRPWLVTGDIDGAPVRLLRPEPELAIVMFHSVFPERTFQLEHFYLPLHLMAQPGFDLDAFMRFAQQSQLDYAVKTQCGLIAALHADQFGFVPGPVERVLETLGANRREVARFAARAGRIPYRFTPRAFWTAFLLKAREWYCFKSLLWQGLKMSNPRFCLDVVHSIRRRLGEQDAYELR